MSQQPELISPPLAANPAPAPESETRLVSGNESVREAGRAPEEATTSTAKYDFVDLDPTTLGPLGTTVNPQRIPRWLERSELFIRVLLRMYIGLAVCYAPWSHMFWDQNPLFLAVSNACQSMPPMARCGA